MGDAGDLGEHRTERVWTRLQTAPLDVGTASGFLAVPAAGGLALFVGTTRQWTAGRETAELEYEAFGPMALLELGRLADEAADRWVAERVVLWHRLGVVPVAEASVVVGVATGHRAEAFEACRWLIDTLKERVPIWKRERYADGATEWVGGSTSRTDGLGDGADR